MTTATELVRRFGGNPDNVQVEIGTPNGWGWADVVLANQLPAGYDGNPYEYVAYDLIRDDWPDTCTAVENGEAGADARLRELMETFRAAFED